MAYFFEFSTPTWNLTINETMPLKETPRTTDFEITTKVYSVNETSTNLDLALVTLEELKVGVMVKNENYAIAYSVPIYTKLNPTSSNIVGTHTYKVPMDAIVQLGDYVRGRCIEEPWVVTAYISVGGTYYDSVVQPAARRHDEFSKDVPFCPRPLPLIVTEQVRKGTSFPYSFDLTLDVDPSTHVSPYYPSDTYKKNLAMLVNNRDTFQGVFVQVLTSTSPNGPFTQVDEVEFTSLSGSISMPSDADAGYVQFRPVVRSRQYSDTYVEGDGEVAETNDIPGPPTLILPPFDAVHFDATHVFLQLKAGTDPQEKKQKYQIKCNKATGPTIEYQGISSFYVEGSAYSAVTIDSAGGTSEPLTGAITVVAPPWGNGARVEVGDAILAAHLIDLRTAVNTIRHYYGLTPQEFTDPEVIPGETMIKAVHITELQTAISEVFTVNTLLTVPVWEAVEPNGRIMASHFNQLRETLEKL